MTSSDNTACHERVFSVLIAVQCSRPQPRAGEPVPRGRTLYTNSSIFSMAWWACRGSEHAHLLLLLLRPWAGLLPPRPVGEGESGCSAGGPDASGRPRGRPRRPLPGLSYTGLGVCSPEAGCCLSLQRQRWGEHATAPRGRGWWSCAPEAQGQRFSSLHSSPAAHLLPQDGGPQLPQFPQTLLI